MKKKGFSKSLLDSSFLEPKSMFVALLPAPLSCQPLVGPRAPGEKHSARAPPSLRRAPVCMRRGGRGAPGGRDGRNIGNTTRINEVMRVGFTTDSFHSRNYTWSLSASIDSVWLDKIEPRDHKGPSEYSIYLNRPPISGCGLQDSGC